MDDCKPAQCWFQLALSNANGDEVCCRFRREADAKCLAILPSAKGNPYHVVLVCTFNAVATYAEASLCWRLLLWLCASSTSVDYQVHPSMSNGEIMRLVAVGSQ
jgi:hypothetical protein